MQAISRGAWRSLVAHRFWEPEVAGSNPAVPTTFLGDTLMKRDMDLIRTLLLEIESWPPGARVPSTKIVIEPYTEEQIRYHAELLHDAGFIGGMLAVHRASGARPTIVGRLTWHGHEFVDATRSDIVWATVKKRAEPVGGSMNMELLAELISSVCRSMMWLPQRHCSSPTRSDLERSQ